MTGLLSTVGQEGKTFCYTADQQSSCDVKSVEMCFDVVDPTAYTSVCGPGFKLLGEYATWCGKINSYRPAGGSWTADRYPKNNCERTDYCQARWSTTSKVIQVAVSQEEKQFAIVGGTLTGNGQEQFLCCGTEQACLAPLEVANLRAIAALVSALWGASAMRRPRAGHSDASHHPCPALPAGQWWHR